MSNGVYVVNMVSHLHITKKCVKDRPLTILNVYMKSPVWTLLPIHIIWKLCSFRKLPSTMYDIIWNLIRLFEFNISVCIHPLNVQHTNRNSLLSLMWIQVFCRVENSNDHIQFPEVITLILIILLQSNHN